MMKRYVLALTLAAASAGAFATDVGVSVHVNQPGVYGRIDIGRVPQAPVLIYPQPVIVQQPAVVVQQAPVYLHVPPGHQKKWKRYCHRYNACGQPVYFVREDWYQRHYAPAVRAPQPRHDHHHHRHDDRRGRSDHRHDDHPGKGHGHGHGKHKD
jgi:hypothetical protein